MKTNKCSVESCTGDSYTKGMCNEHYHQFKERTFMEYKDDFLRSFDATLMNKYREKEKELENVCPVDPAEAALCDSCS